MNREPKQMLDFLVNIDEGIGPCERCKICKTAPLTVP